MSLDQTGAPLRIDSGDAQEPVFTPPRVKRYKNRSFHPAELAEDAVGSGPQVPRSAQVEAGSGAQVQAQAGTPLTRTG